MTERFDDAAVRHYADADLLQAQARPDNADQLYGFAAECAMKLALISPASHANAGDLPGTFRHHVDVLWARVSIGAVPRQYATLLAVLKQPNPFHDWSVDQRYYPTGHVSAEALERHRNAARRILGAMRIIGVRA
ncbi:MAG: hypothetical protein ACTHNO_00180 [Ralstonia sp.]|uniref:hypothetical protein n=1 Tax=Ralstonia sp. TaxID=54061 RepID=UPI003F7E1123